MGPSSETFYPGGARIVFVRATDGAAKPHADQRGNSLVEFVIVFPVFALLLFGFIEFGIAIANRIDLTHGVREGARQAAVANFSGGNSACAAQATPDAQLRCFTRDRIGDSDAAVNVLVPNGSAVGSEVVVCASTPTASITGLMKPFLPSFQHSQVNMRIESLPAGVALAPGADPAPAGDSWAWCQA